MAKVKNRRDNHNIKRPKSHAGYGESAGTGEMRERASRSRQADASKPRRTGASSETRGRRSFQEREDRELDANIIIGRNPVTEALKAGREVDKLLVTSREGSMIKILALAKEQGIPVMYVEKAAIDRIAQGKAHQGVAAYVSPYAYSTVDDILANAAEKGEDPFIVILDGLEDPHNLGAKTFSQLEDVDYVTFQVEGAPLTDHYGNVIGNMSADTFIYNVGKEISTYEKIELKLYFANETGDKLIPVYRSVVYNSNISMERLAVEQIISGPNTDIAFPTINKDTKVKSVNIKDGVCYVDFDQTILNQTQNVSAEVALYSIVNTITEFSDVNKVVLSVEGETAFTFMDFVISGSYERNLDIIE